MLSSDDPLVAQQAQETAAQVDPAHPLGKPGDPVPQRAPLRFGFLAGIGLLLAVALAETAILAARVLLLLSIAALISVGLEPVVRWLGRRGLKRGLAVAVVALAMLGLTAAFVVQAAPPIAKEASQAVDQVPTFLHQLQDKSTFLGKLNAKYNLEEGAKSAVSVTSLGGVLHVGGVVVSLAADVLIVLVLSIYFLSNLPWLKKVFYLLIPRSRRPRVGLITDEIIDRVGGYVLGNVLTSLIAIAANYALLRVLGVPYALVLSVLVGVLDLVPLVGSITGGFIVALVAFAAVSLTAAIITIVAHIVYRGLEDYLLSPRIMRATVSVRPVVTIVAVLVGGTLLGVVGAILAVPVAATLQLIATEVILPAQDAS